MSYCVNCGVELDPSLKRCPLCNTPVVNPAHLRELTPVASPFPPNKGEVDILHKKDFAVVLSTFLFSTAAACALLNFFRFKQALWSLPIIGICLVLWVVIIPLLWYRNISPYLSLMLDGIVMLIYLYLLTWLTPSADWFWRIGTPIVLLITFLTEFTTFLCRKFRVSFLAAALYVVIDAAILCVGIESILDYYLRYEISLGWSAVVLTACAITAITLLTLLSKKKWRNAVRRRLHF